VIAGPARQKLHRMTQLEPIASGEIGTELGTDLTFKLSTLGRFPDMEFSPGWYGRKFCRRFSRPPADILTTETRVGRGILHQIDNR
jgi:hypothetical protein